MVELDLNEDERAELVEILESTLSDLRMEIADTDRLAFRNHLKHRKQILIRTLDQLTAIPRTR